MPDAAFDKLLFYVLVNLALGMATVNEVSDD